MVDSLKKVSIFFSLFDLNKSIDWPLLFHELKALTTYVNPDHILPVEGLIYLIKNCLLSILWYFNDIEEKADNIDSKSCEELRQMLDEFVNILIFILGHTFTENLKEAVSFLIILCYHLYYNQIFYYRLLRLCVTSSYSLITIYCLRKVLNLLNLLINQMILWQKH